VIGSQAVRRRARPGLLAAALGCCGYGLFAQRHAVGMALHQFAWYQVAGAGLAAIAGLACMMLAWRTLLADLGSPLPVSSAGRILFIAQLAKYVPGAVWAAAAQVELARGYQVPRRRSATATVAGMLVTLATGLLTAAVALPLRSADAARAYWWALALAVPALLGLYPPVTSLVLDRLLRLARRPPLERQLTGTGMARAVGWSVAGWTFFGVHAWLLVTAVTRPGLALLPLAAGAFALAWSVGFILIPFPGGLGPRELALIAALAPVMPAGPAITVAVISRLIMTIADLAWAGLAFALVRGGRPATSRLARAVDRGAGEDGIPERSGPAVPARESRTAHRSYP
jgi:hypothetical protein